MKPGSLPWLLRWELKLNWRELRGGQNIAMPRWLGIGLTGLLLLLLHALPALLFWLDRAKPANPAKFEQALLPLLGGLLLVMLLAAAIMAMQRAVSVLYERHDIDLLLSAPIDTAWILSSRALGLALSSAALVGLIALPFAHVGWLFGHWNTLLLYPLTLSIGLLATAPALWLVFVLVRLLGPRRARSVGQWLMMGIGLAVMVASQLLGRLDAHLPAGASFMERAGGMLRWLGRAVAGEPLPVLAITAVALLLFGLTVWAGRRRFVEISQADATRQAASGRPAGELRFGRSLGWLIVRKEWRLILRQPSVISMLAMPAILLAAMVFGQVGGRGGGGVQSLHLFMLGMLYASTASNLCWLAMSLDEAAPLLYGAPVEVERIRRWQVAAVLFPLLLTLPLPLGVIAAHAPLQAAILAPIVVMATLAGALVARWRFRPVARSLMKKAFGRTTRETVLDAVHTALWGGAAMAAGGSGFGYLCLPLALLFPFLVWMKTEEREYLYD